MPPGAVHETGSFLFELQGDDVGEAQMSVDGRPLEALRGSPSRARWRWQPGFQAGEVEIELRIPGLGVRRTSVTTDPDLRKLTRRDFDAMLREILEDTFALFSLSSFRRSVSRGAGGPVPPIARLEFIRSRVEELEQVVAAIARAPRRRLRAKETVVPWHKARHATGAEIMRSLRIGRVLRETRTPSRLPAPLQGQLPDRIRTTKRTDTSDLPEHREMAACLRSWREWLRAVSGRLAASPSPGGGTDWAARTQSLARLLDAMLAREPFSGLPEIPATLTLTSLFRNDPRYRKFYALWRDMNLGIASVFGEFLAMPLARTFELYELWCFLRIARAAADRWGTEGCGSEELFRIAGSSLTVDSSATTFTAGAGWRVAFQPRYAEFWSSANGRGSYSRPMTPDIAIWREVDGTTGSLVVLDAKYRIDQGLSDALTSIHTYRDAIVDTAEGEIGSAVSSAYLLTPHASRGAGPYEAAAMPDRLFREEYIREFRFGAVTLRPGMNHVDIAKALDRMTAAIATEAPN
ncbi:DUF2357 domain-containing protein [Sphingomonas koreensis]|nr:DUF2357 domain-containing protein [Sphingomonas koreensis]